MRPESTGLQLAISAAAQHFQSFHQVTGAAQRRLRVQLFQQGGQVAFNCLPRVFQQSRVVQTERRRQGPSQAGYPTDIEASQGTEQTDQLLLGRGLPQGMQPVLNLDIFNFAKVTINFQHEPAKIIRLSLHSQVPMEFSLLHHFPDLSFQYGQLARIQGLALVMLIHQLFQPGNIAVTVGGRHRRDQMINDGGVGAPLGLGTLSWVVDDKGIEQGHISQSYFRITGAGQSDALAGQPLQGTVLAHVNHGIRLEYIPDPAVIGNVVVGRGQVGAMVNGNGIFSEAPGRLQSDEDITQLQAGYGKGIPDAVNLSRRVTPSLL